MEAVVSVLGAILAELTGILEVLRALRDDLKRREARHLQDTKGWPDRKAAPSTNGSGARFGSYGRRAGESVAGAAMDDLEFYKRGCERTLSDPAKSRFHDKERVLLAAIEAEIERQRGPSQQPAPSAADFGGGDDSDLPF